MVNLWLMKNNPIDELLNFWVLTAIKMYYLPYFIAGNADNIKDLCRPQTYSICQ